MMQANWPYEETDPQKIRDDMFFLSSCMDQGELSKLISTYFTSDQLRELIDDRMMGRV